MLAEVGELLRRALILVLGALEVVALEVLEAEIMLELMVQQEQAVVVVVVTTRQPTPLVV